MTSRPAGACNRKRQTLAPNSGVDEIKDGGGGRKSDGRGETSMGSVCEDGGEGRARGHRRLEAASGWIHARVHVHGRRGRGLSLSESKESGRFGMVTVMG
jgi:hypothetical protein